MASLNLFPTAAGVYFTVYTPSTGRELWFSDGTAAGTHLVRDINPGPEDSQIISLSRLNAKDGRILFGADDGVHGTELWQSDTTGACTFVAEDLNPGFEGSMPSAAVVMNGKAFFSAWDGRLTGTGQELRVMSVVPTAAQEGWQLYP